MNFYSSIHSHYDYIFPLNVKQVEFIEDEIVDRNSSLLDIGCATGNLAIRLAEKGYRVKAFDLDDLMIKTAKQKIDLPNLEITQGDMLEIHSNYAPNSFNGVLCFGNTIVHLTNLETIAGFFNSVHQILNKGGKFLFQVLNYEYILNEKLSQLPEIENNILKFDRNYEYLSNGLINFNTKLVIKESNQVFENQVKLYPVTKKEINKLLVNSGFHAIEFFGDFAKNELAKTSLPLVIKAIK